MGGLSGVGVVIFGRWVVWGGVGLVLVVTFGCFTVIPEAGLVESKGL